MSKAADLDVVVFGATSFVGQIVCQYLLSQYAAKQENGGLRWAMAGRSQSKLERVARALDAPGIELLVADAEDEVAIAAMCRRTRVVLSTVGPYDQYGETLVKTCAATGTDYVDLTGEVHWIRAMLDRYESMARNTGARLVHCCGFDSIPSDLGVYFLQQQASKRLGQPCQRVKLRVKAVKGGFSGGTVASMLNLIGRAAHDKALRRQLADPYLIAPEPAPRELQQPDVKAPVYDRDFKSWVAPFIMSGINTRVVQRSNLLSADAVSGFRYDEAVLTGDGPKGWLIAQGMAAGLAGFVAAVALKPSRWVLEKLVLPMPGEGPTPEQQKNGFFDLRLFGQTADGQCIRVKVSGDRDPGYGATAKMVAEAAVCLAQDLVGSDAGGGFWTPATLLAEPLLKRLEANAGLSFEVL